MPSPFRRTQGVFVALVILGLIGAWFLPRWLAQRKSTFDTPAQIAPRSPTTSSSVPAFPVPDRPALHPVAPISNHPRSPLADTLNSPTTTASDDLKAIAQMLTLYRERFDAYPAFEDNAHLVNALAGANPLGIAWLPRDTPAISPQSGALLDRWGSAYLFHSISRGALELRSIGPDRTAYTEDDVLLPLGVPPSAEKRPPSGPAPRNDSSHSPQPDGDLPH
jgi:Type II secretion system (T2SS), protein G